MKCFMKLQAPFLTSEHDREDRLIEGQNRAVVVCGPNVLITTTALSR